MRQKPVVVWITTRTCFSWSRIAIFFYPGRFVIAIDNAFYFQWEQKFIPQVMFRRKALTGLPEDVADRIAYDNARRFWMLPEHGHGLRQHVKKILKRTPLHKTTYRLPEPADGMSLG